MADDELVARIQVALEADPPAIVPSVTRYYAEVAAMVARSFLSYAGGGPEAAPPVP